MRRALVTALASFAAACSILTSFDGIGPHALPASSPDDASTMADVEAGPPSCVHAHWPSRPAGVDPPRDLGELTAAVTRLRILDPTTQGKPLGFDLDGLCTCPDPAACVGQRADMPCDTDAGIDNAGDGLFRLLAGQGLPLDDTGLRTGITAGQYGLVLRLTGYSGDASDPSVGVAFFNAVGVNGDGGVPREDGRDDWVIDEESLIDQKFPAFIATSAYVSDRVLVAEFVRLVVRARVPTGNSSWGLIELELRDAHVVASLGVPGNGGVPLSDGQIVGRMPLASFLAQGMRSGACLDSGLYQAVKPIVCAARDLPLDPAKDGRDTPCEALSSAFGFDAIAALRSTTSATRVDPSACTIVPDQCD
jgi:hypothetical protein